MYIYCKYIPSFTHWWTPSETCFNVFFVWGRLREHLDQHFLGTFANSVAFVCWPSGPNPSDCVFSGGQFHYGAEMFVVHTEHCNISWKGNRSKKQSVVTKITCKKASLKQQECHFPRQFLNLLHYFLVLPSLLFRGGVHFCSPHHFCVGARANFNSDSAQGSVQCFTPWGLVIHRRLAGMSWWLWTCHWRPAIAVSEMIALPKWRRHASWRLFFFLGWVNCKNSKE